MTPAARLAAIDLGATSGRVILGSVGPNELELRQLARFPNDPVPLRDGLHWNLLGLYRNALDGLALAVREEPGLASVGIDSWAVDYALLHDGRMLGAPFHYRDPRRGAVGPPLVHEHVDAAELYRRNGLQHLPFNTMFQLACDRADGVLDGADTMLLIPDLLVFELTGAISAERTNASTTGLLDAATREWDEGLADTLGIPRRVLPPLVDPGTRIGMVSGAALEVVGAPVPVTAVGSHDTASAVVALPTTSDDIAYISCGTWGLVGVELAHPVLTDAARRASFTNEGGVDGRVRFLHNVMGLWLLSECVRVWGEALPTLLEQAAAVQASVPVFDVDDPRFLAPGDMPARIADWLREHELPVPASRPALVRCIVESLAQAFASTVSVAASLSGAAVSAIHLVGGGAQNALLCQATADRSGLPVIAGPVEATAIGNLLVQARAVGAASGSLESLRALVAATQRPQTYTPTTTRKPVTHG
ncbi:rhamnulokinase [Gryllotalpicola protaetiae]|uniref:Rhamnulokinase n=1 Tax=Gryllotalpicola protaetiae TaxID=2419771 RepID=A0A387BIH5_9MICO|nr:rhamnulokinase family protein [Gryllotalpicola protaetiae]AYG02498.1 rhamnulokinase [Gryllotalpicola protaetiae]